MKTGPAKKLYIKTYGCQMNVYDSARMADVLAPLGYALGESPEDADMVVLNTCHIREKAADKVYSELGRLRVLKAERKEQGKGLTIAVAGCVAQAEGQEMIRREPAIDLVVGPQSYHRMPEMIARIARGAGHALETDFPAEEKFDSLPQENAAPGPTAFLTIQEGCDKFCTFCVVPYTRGAEFSRPAEGILREAGRLAEKGAREITLLGQNVNAYIAQGTDGAEWSLARLVRELAKIEGLKRIRYTTSHPRDMAEDLIAAHGSEEKLMPFLHLPVQSGSDKILRVMNRGHTRAEYIALIARVRRARPDIALSSDFIVGFPHESEEDFEATLSLIREVGFAQSYFFKYSPRPGTPASAMEKQLPEEVKDERLQRLEALIEEQSRAFNETTLGKTMPVLFEREGRRPGQAIGKTPYLQAVHVPGTPSLAGQIREVRLETLFERSLRGSLIAPEHTASAEGALAD